MSPEAAKRPPETPNEAAQATLISQIAAHWKKFRLGNELIFSWLKMQRLDQRFLKKEDHPHAPKYAVSQVVGFIKGKSAIHLARVYGERKQNYAGQNFWARGYFVSTVGRDEATIRDYLRNQGQEDKRIDQLNMWR